MSERKVAVFFYGSYMSRAVLAEVGLRPGRFEVARLVGFDISIRPLANLVPAATESVYGILTTATHDELELLYAHARNVLGGVYLPEAVVVETSDGSRVPALCYVAHELEPQPAENGYVDRIVQPAREHGFPAPYIKRLESFRR
jgi:hypothetical protein